MGFSGEAFEASAEEAQAAIEAEIDGQSVLQAPQHQPRCGQKHDRKCDLCAHHDVAQRPSAGSGFREIILQSRDQIGLGCLPRRSKPDKDFPSHSYFLSHWPHLSNPESFRQWLDG